MSILHICEGMKAATLVATLRLRIMYMILKIALEILCSMWVKYTMKFDFKNCILVQNSSKMFWRFYAVCGSNTLWILILKIVFYILVQNSSRVKYTMNFERFSTGPTICNISSLGIVYAWKFDGDVVWGSRMLISKINTHIQCFCSWSEGKYLLTKKPARGT